MFEADFKHLLIALPACNAFFEFLSGIVAFKKFYTFTCCLGGYLLIAVNVIKYVPFYSLFIIQKQPSSLEEIKFEKLGSLIGWGLFVSYLKDKNFSRHVVFTKW